MLEYLHRNGIAHRDLKVNILCHQKPENLILTKSYHLKLVDFGTALIFNCNLITKEERLSIQKYKKQENEELELDLYTRRGSYDGTKLYCKLV
jgi:serine/threonine protein kinase